MDKNVSPNYSSSQITYVETEAAEFLRFRFHRKRTASSFHFHIPGLETCLDISRFFMSRSQVSSQSRSRRISVSVSSYIKLDEIKLI